RSVRFVPRRRNANGESSASAGEEHARENQCSRSSSETTPRLHFESCIGILTSSGTHVAFTSATNAAKGGDIMFSLRGWQCVVVGLLMTTATASAQGPPPEPGTTPSGNMW